MNRQTILSSIDRRLRESLAQSGEVRPLGEIVPLVAEDIRPSSYGSYANPPVIRIEHVAAFIEGRLSDEEMRSVCNAAMFDNSVLAELIAGVRATTEVQTLAPISAALTDRLMAMQPQSPTANASDAGASRNTIAVQPTSPTVQPHRTRRSRTKTVVAVLAVAATLLGLVFVASRRQQRAPQENEVAKDPQVIPDERTWVPDVNPPLLPDPVNDESAVASDDTTPDAQTDPKLDPIPPAVDPSAVVRDETPEVSPKPEPMEVEPIRLDPAPPTDSGPAVARLANLRWTEITGLLTERNQRDGSTGPVFAPTWRSIQADASQDDEAPVKDKVALRTLPLSRAEATLATGGRIVLAGDSGIQVTRTNPNSSATIELQHGSVAMMDLPEGTIIDLKVADRIVATLRWQEKASAVLQRAAAGLQIHIDRGTIAVNDEPQSDSALLVAANRPVETIVKPKRIPAWVDRPVDYINVPRPFLAQLAESTDVTAMLNQRINTLASQPSLSADDSRTLTTLSQWQVAMAGPNVLRLGNSRHAVLRMVALNQLINLPSHDPRYPRIWAVIARTTNNPQRAMHLRRLCAMARDGVRPNAAQIEVLLSGLSAQEISGRALCDYLLRVFHGGGPVFDPTWTGQANIRGATQWRAFAGRSTVRGTNQGRPAIRDVP